MNLDFGIRLLVRGLSVRAAGEGNKDCNADTHGPHGITVHGHETKTTAVTARQGTELSTRTPIPERPSACRSTEQER